MFNTARGVTVIQYSRHAALSDRIINIRQARKMVGTPRQLKREAAALEGAAEMVRRMRPLASEDQEHLADEMLAWAAAKRRSARSMRWINL